jgi:c-di-GMP-binding flagellar brake protein YcgR
MVNNQKIQGRDVLRLFRDLQGENTLLKLYLPGNDFKYLTRITDIQTHNKTTCFIVDYPEGLDDSDKLAFEKTSTAGAMKFEFTGKDHIRYAFSSVPARFGKEKIWLPLPRTVEREQRRRQFRISAPPGSVLRFELNAVRYELKIIDISLGGTLGVLAGSAQENSRNSHLEQTRQIETLKLSFASDNEQIQVIIKRAEVKRLKHNPHHYEYALEFKDIDSRNKKKLNDLIYRFQREFLRKRLRINA